LGSAEQEVADLQRRFRGPLEARLREAVVDSESGFFGLLRYHLGWQEADGTPSSAPVGKGLRPLLCLTACELAGGDWKRALPAAAALELIHNFSLIHDDIQDRDGHRWDRETLWSVYGVPPAISAGNAMRVIADQTLLTLVGSGLTTASVTQAAMELTERYLEMIEGQYMDMSFEQAEHVTIDEYLDMVGRKTGALIESAMYMGALVATSDRDTARTFGSCGRRLGLAFQIRDDYLGIWGDPAITRKPVGSDIRRKKKSLPIVHLFQNASESDRAWLDQAYAGEEVSGEDAERVLEMLDRFGTPAYVQRSAQEHADAAVREVRRLALPDDATRKLEAMAEVFVTREQ
jgi:geranylgeranyl diphosphate synthase type I